MYAVIKTGGKQYRVQAGDSLSVEKLDVETGEMFNFDQVLLIEDGDKVIVGTPFIENAVVRAEVVENYKDDKVLVFKKKRRKQYRRTRGHRQNETVLRVTAIDGAGKSSKWDGTVDLTPKAVLDARARGLDPAVALATGPKAKVAAEPVAEAKPAKAPAKKAAAPKAEAGEKKAAPKKAAAKKTESDAE